ncbi:hypothetical protein SDC9_114632 [bioreactor metagenome]|uniref:Uncharacterized protein n=1 Tax=bioreactor metagenome TaxID=1076179 RepID=A0A645BRJ0_9ZZZZ
MIDRNRDVGKRSGTGGNLPVLCNGELPFALVKAVCDGIVVLHVAKQLSARNDDLLRTAPLDITGRCGEFSQRIGEAGGEVGEAHHAVRVGSDFSRDCDAMCSACQLEGGTGQGRPVIRLRLIEREGAEVAFDLGACEVRGLHSSREFCRV